MDLLLPTWTHLQMILRHLIPLKSHSVGLYVPLLSDIGHMQITDAQANREDLEAANLVLSWWNDGQSTRHQPPLHTDPVSPNQSTKPDIPTTYDHNQNQNQNHSHNLTRSSTQPVAEPFNLAAVDRWTPSMASATVPTHTHTHSSTPDSSTAPASIAGSGSGEARKITLKVNKV
jgi:hypothetical protein